MRSLIWPLKVKDTTKVVTSTYILISMHATLSRGGGGRCGVLGEKYRWGGGGGDQCMKKYYATSTLRKKLS